MEFDPCLSRLLHGFDGSCPPTALAPASVAPYRGCLTLTVTLNRRRGAILSVDQDAARRGGGWIRDLFLAVKSGSIDDASEEPLGFR
jgi:hypothetical protein